MKCATEGEDWRQTQTWTLFGEARGVQRLTIKGPKRTFLYRRCEGSKKGATR
ncbi:hypothetical protein OKC48_13600 [Methylorubrum extorquens]|uniref:hypothetical protein n=1 Tax=Methylorubrum extorquens TaxID=408 RepID=UPI00223708A3|nr:hypothetical protein [Methylorubrum extorquens]UYW29490.1 hypothetical protein OKC48_13600 [Methylorubrum extorquens]